MKSNNLDALRLIAAGLVFYGHSFVFLGLPAPLFLSWLPLGSLGVFIFFIISGYLVSESWARDPHLFRFFARRGLRIFPGLAVCILLSVFVLGPLFTTRGLHDYFHDQYTWGYLRNIALYISYYLPGVFETNRLPNAVNGSLWSLPVEFLMYIMVSFMGVLRGNRWAFAALFAASAAISLFWAQSAPQMVVVYAFDLRQVFLCGTYFWAGAVFGKFALTRYFSGSALLMACFLLLCLEPWPAWLAVASWGLLPLVVLGFGLEYSPMLAGLARRGDYSYGVYIYAFPVQQAVAFAWPGIGIVGYVLASGAITLILAMLSYHLIERRALTMKPRRARATDSDFDASQNGKGFASAYEPDAVERLG